MYTNEGKVGQITDVDYKLASIHSIQEYTWYRLLNQQIESTHSKSVTGYNTRYSFDMKRSNDAWVLTKLRSARHPAHARYEFLHLPIAFRDSRFTYRAAFDRSDTRISGPKPIDWRGQPHTEWIFDTIFHSVIDGKPVKYRYGLIIPADRPGMVVAQRSYELQVPGKIAEPHWLQELVVEYEPGDEAWPAIKSIDMYATDRTSNYTPWRYHRIEVLEYHRLPGPPPDQEFTLSAFGLPEPRSLPDDAAGSGSGPGPMGDINDIPYRPIQVEPEGGGWWWWLILLVGVIIAGTGGYILYRRWRK
jgi:hypothetical protein